MLFHRTAEQIEGMVQGRGRGGGHGVAHIARGGVFVNHHSPEFIGKNGQK